MAGRLGPIDFTCCFRDNPSTLKTSPGSLPNLMVNHSKRTFHVAREPEIKAGHVSDIHVARTNRERGLCLDH